MRALRPTADAHICVPSLQGPRPYRHPHAHDLGPQPPRCGLLHVATAWCRRCNAVTSKGVATTLSTLAGHAAGRAHPGGMMRVKGSPSFASMCPISLYAASPVGARYAATRACAGIGFSCWGLSACVRPQERTHADWSRTGARDGHLAQLALPLMPAKLAVHIRLGHDRPRLQGTGVF